eukprot:1157877-Pelagomonas_calceolata.AAC.8
MRCLEHHMHSATHISKGVASSAARIQGPLCWGAQACRHMQWQYLVPLTFLKVGCQSAFLCHQGLVLAE